MIKTDELDYKTAQDRYFSQYERVVGFGMATFAYHFGSFSGVLKPEDAARKVNHAKKRGFPASDWLVEFSDAYRELGEA